MSVARPQRMRSEGKRRGRQRHLFHVPPFPRFYCLALRSFFASRAHANDRAAEGRERIACTRLSTANMSPALAGSAVCFRKKRKKRENKKRINFVLPFRLRRSSSSRPLVRFFRQRCAARLLRYSGERRGGPLRRQITNKC